MSFANIRVVAQHLGSCVIILASGYASVEAGGRNRKQAEQGNRKQEEKNWKQEERNWKQEVQENRKQEEQGNRKQEEEGMARRQRKLSLLSLCSTSSGGMGELI